MKSLKNCGSLAIIAFALTMALGAFAKDKNHHAVSMPENVQVGTTTLAPGSYTMDWNDNGFAADVTFLKNGKSVAHVPAKIVNLDHPAQADEVTLKTESEKTGALEEIEFAGHKQALVFTDNQNTGE